MTETFKPSFRVEKGDNGSVLVTIERGSSSKAKPDIALEFSRTDARILGQCLVSCTDERELQESSAV